MVEIFLESTRWGVNNLEGRLYRGAFPIRSGEKNTKTLSAMLILFALICGCAHSQEAVVSARLEEIPEVPAFIVAAILKVGGHSALVKLVVDSGSDHSMISPDVIKAMGFTIPEGSKGGTIGGMTGTAQAIRAWIDSIEVQGIKDGPFVIVIFKPEVLEGVDGILGRDFLFKLKGVTLNRENGKVTFFK